jgi:hypothetical protein
MYLEVLGTTEALVTLEAVVRLLIGVRPHMNQHFIPDEGN